ncbi:MAG: ATP-binding cassette domain-containing protein [Thermoleophilia bacterium]|nr:ATP-binding cassette domain-containing protein [Thermoleophilia bacterium]
MTAEVLLSVTNLTKHFPGRGGTVRAVDNVSFSISRGETLALVGESGSGKSTTARLVLRLLEATSGAVEFDGVDVLHAGRAELRTLRRQMQIVFQDPYASLDPVHRVEKALMEPFAIHGIGSRHEQRASVASLLERVGLDPAMGRRFPSEFSGGQRQRIAIARAIALEPSLVVCDEPVSALDVSIQAQVLNLLRRLQIDLGLTYLFISHDLSVVRHIADRVAVMYLGEIVELADCDAFFSNPRHPYSLSLLSAVPHPDPVVERSRDRIVLRGDLPSPSNPPSGCRFRTRCWKAEDICATQPPLLAADARGHAVACHFPEGTTRASGSGL